MREAPNEQAATGVAGSGDGQAIRYGMVLPASARRVRPSVRRRRVPGAKRIRNKELSPFTRQLAAMLGSGISILPALDGLHDQAVSPRFKRVILEIKNGIEGGRTYSDMLLNYPGLFDDLYVNMMTAGELSGRLAEAAARVADFLDASAKLRRKVRGALCYPIIVLSIAAVITAAMIVFVVPIFAEMYKGFRAQLPGPTRALVRVAHSSRRAVPAVAAGIVVLVVTLRRLRRTRWGGYALDRALLALPVAGTLAQKVALSRFARILAQLIRSGVQILNALDIVACSTGNRVYQRALAAAGPRVERGDPLSVILQQSRHFPPLLVHMMSAGEKTGKMVEMMETVAAYYEDEVKTMLDGLMAMLEPILIAVLGIVVGGIVICMFLPIFKLAEVVGV